MFESLTNFITSDRIFLYVVVFLILAGVLVIEDMLWYSQHSLHISRSRLMTCRQCGHVFLQHRQQIERRCPLCGGSASSFRLPYSGVHEKLRDRAKKT